YLIPPPIRARAINDNEPSLRTQSEYLNDEIIFHNKTNSYSAIFKTRNASNYPSDSKYNIQSRVISDDVSDDDSGDDNNSEDGNNDNEAGPSIQRMFFNGDSLFNSDDEGCSAGFKARNGSDEYVVIAGHCFNKESYGRRYYVTFQTENGFEKFFVGTAEYSQIEPFDYGLILGHSEEIKHSPNIIHREVFDHTGEGDIEQRIVRDYLPKVRFLSRTKPAKFFMLWLENQG
ncbi:7105_t:CDS:2, partial [Racocetra fulgida]